MKIGEAHIYAPKSTLGLKKSLLKLNQDLDSIKRDINFNADYGFYFEHSIYPFNHTLTNFEIAVLYLEDRRFFSHSGVELRSLLRGLKRLLLRGSINGISTIDQQVVRISLKRSERTLSRKVNELILAFCLNLHVSKRQILDYYIHNAYVGYKMQGCEVAAQKSFGLVAAVLNPKQAAFIASLLPLPFPRVVWEAYSSRVDYPFADPEDIIEIANDLAPRWASRVNFRMKLALKSYDFMPRSL